MWHFLEGDLSYDPKKLYAFLMPTVALIVLKYLNFPRKLCATATAQTEKVGKMNVPTILTDFPYLFLSPHT